MAAFRYQALDSNGKSIQDVIEADSARHARSQLRSSGLTVVEIHSVSESNGRGANLSRTLTFKKKIALSDLSLMMRQMATLLDAGLTLEQSLTALIEQSENIQLRNVLASIRSEILAGHSLGRAMDMHKSVFPEIYRALVHAGEESGALPTVMEKLASYSESQQALRQKIGLAFVYPLIVTIVAILVIGGLLVFVVPQVVEVFQQSHQTLPLLTRVMIFISTVLSDYWIYLIVTVLAASWSVIHILKKETYRMAFDNKLIRLPILGKLIRNINTARLASTLAILFNSGVPLVTSLKAAQGVVSNRKMREAVADANNKVREGISLSRALSASGIFPPVLIHLIASGEASGKLDRMLEKVAAQQEQEVNNVTSALTTLLEPLMIVLMGGVVLLIVLAVLMPVIEMNQLLK